MAEIASKNKAVWFLEGFLEGGKHIWRVPLRAFPFRIGRRPDLSLTLNSNSVSQEHAELTLGEDGLLLRDLHSTNGTFVNRRRIDAQTSLEQGDIVHFAMIEFRVGLERAQDWSTMTNATILREGDLPSQMVIGTRQLQQLLRERAVVPMFQPIVNLRAPGEKAYELLGRGSLASLPSSPGELFRIAASLGVEAELSRMFRSVGVAQATSLPGNPMIFVNTHPSEGHAKGLIESVKEIRQASPGQRLVLEIHEAAVTHSKAMAELRAMLSELDVMLAYDDFGAGQARLMELAEVPPDFVKFDISMVRKIHEAPAPRQQMLETLVSMVRDWGIAPLAEGIENAEEAKACEDLGFQYAQGFHYGKPAPVSDFLSTTAVIENRDLPRFESRP